jgi:hypothetical protein
MTDQSIEDASRIEFDTYFKATFINKNASQSDIAFEFYKRGLAARQSSQSEPVATADYVAYLYRDHNGTLKLAQEVPPPDNAFPVFTTNIRFLDVARLVLDDNVDLILEHGGVKLWEALITDVNKNYAEINHEQ